MFYARLAAACVVFCASSLMIGCAARTSSTDIGTASIDDCYRLLDEKQFCQAYVCYTKIRPDLEKMEENAAGYEYQRLIAATAGVGEASWIQILKSPAIPLDYRLDLVREIDEEARRAKP